MRNRGAQAADGALEDRGRIRTGSLILCVTLQTIADNRADSFYGTRGFLLACKELDLRLFCLGSLRGYGLFLVDTTNFAYELIVGLF